MTHQDPVVPSATRSGQAATAATAAADIDPPSLEFGTAVASAETGGPGSAGVPIQIVRGAEAQQAAQVADAVAAQLRRSEDEEAEAAARRRAEFAAPALRVIESDPAARAALEAARPGVERASLSAFSLVVHDDTTFVVPPYDEPWYEGYPAQRTVDTGSGAIDLWLRFPIQPGDQRYVAHVGAWLQCDAVSAWGGITGVGEALASVQAVVKWMVVAKV